jgi:hypothetical protein
VTPKEATAIERGDWVRLQQFPRYKGLVVKIVPPKGYKPGRFEVYIQGLGLVKDVMSSDMTLVQKRSQEDADYDKAR